MADLWGAGARTIDTLPADGGYSVAINAATTGAIVGFRSGDYDPAPHTITHGFQIDTARWRVVENGEPISGWTPFSGVEHFTIQRFDGKVYLYVGEPSSSLPYPAHPWGSLVHTNDTAPVGELYLAASLAASFDAVDTVLSFRGPQAVDAGMNLQVPLATVKAAFHHTSIEVPVAGVQASDVAGVVDLRVPLPVLTSRSFQQGADFEVPVATVAADGRARGADFQVPLPDVDGRGFEASLYADVPLPLLQAAAWNGYVRPSGAAIDVPLPLVGSSAPLVSNPGADLQVPVAEVYAADKYTTIVRAEVPVPQLIAYGETVPAWPKFEVIIPSIVSVEGLIVDSIRSRGMFFDRVDDDRDHDALQERATFRDSFTDQMGDRVRERARMRGTFTQVIVDKVVAHWVARDRTEDFTADMLRETAAMRSRITDRTIQHERVAEHARMRSRLVDAVLDSVSERATMQARVTDFLQDRVRETATMLARVVDRAEATDRIREHALFKDAYRHAQLVADSIIEQAAMHDRVVDEFGGAWVMNTQSLAAWRYSDYRVTQVANVGDVTFGIGPEGLLLVGGDSDDGREVSALVEWGVLALGPMDRAGVPTQNLQVKQVQDMWVASAGGDPIRLELQVPDQANRWYPYTIPPMDRAAPQSQRTLIGRGLRGCYWRAKLTNIDGGQLDVSEFEATVEDSQRKR